jgi:hypothetical protein
LNGISDQFDTSRQIQIDHQDAGPLALYQGTPSHEIRAGAGEAHIGRAQHGMRERRPQSGVTNDDGNRGIHSIRRSIGNASCQDCNIQPAG